MERRKGGEEKAHEKFTALDAHHSHHVCGHNRPHTRGERRQDYQLSASLALDTVKGWPLHFLTTCTELRTRLHDEKVWGGWT